MTKTAYTIGRESSYDRDLLEQVNLTKCGSDPAEGYEGGAVWKTPDEANLFMLGSTLYNYLYAVYELELTNGWDQDVKPDSGEGFSRLQVDAKIKSKVVNAPIAGLRGQKIQP